MKENSTSPASSSKCCHLSPWHTSFTALGVPYGCPWPLTRAASPVPQLKDGANGWLQGAPLAAEQADVAQSQQDVQQAQQLQLTLQTNGGQLGAGNPAEVRDY